MITSLLTKLHIRRWPHATRSGRLPARALLATLAGASLVAALAAGPAGPAGAQTAPSPARGLTPSAAVAGGDVLLFYTRQVAPAADSSVWMKDVSTGQITPVGGRLIGGPAAMASGHGAFVFGRGTDNQLWVNGCNIFGSCGSWLPLGGRLTSSPAAVFRGPGLADYSVYARGTDGAVWARDATSVRGGARWGPWHRIGGQVLAGTAPAAAFIDGTYLLVAGTNRALYIEKVGVTGFVPAGGATTATPALTAIPGALVGFARGTDNAGYYHRFLSSSPGWHWMGGRLTSGLAAATSVFGPPVRTFTFGLGTDGQIYENAAAWAGYPPFVTGWHRVT